MAYIVPGSFTTTSITAPGAGAAYTVSSLPTHVADDVLCCGFSQDNGSGVLSLGFSTLTVDSGAANTMTHTGGLTLTAGDQVIFTGTTAPPPLVLNTIYYVVDVVGNAFAVEASVGSGEIDLTGNGSSVTVHQWSKDGWFARGLKATAGVNPSTPAGAAYQHIFTKVATSGSTTAPSFYSTANNVALLSFVVLRDVDTTTPVDVVSTQLDWNAPATGVAASPTLTPTTAGCLLLYWWVSDGNVLFRPDITQCVPVGAVTNGTVSMACAMRQTDSTSVTPTVNSYTNTSAEGGTAWAIAFKNKTNGSKQPDIRITGTAVNHYGIIGDLRTPITWTIAAAAGTEFSGGFTSGALDGVTVATTGVTVNENSSTVVSAYSTTTAITCATSTSGLWAGMWHPYAADLTGTLFTVEVAGSVASTAATMGSKGIIVGFSDGTNFAFFPILNQVKGWATITQYRATIACGVTTPVAAYTKGTLNWGAITQICYMYHRIGSVTTDTGFFVQNAFTISAIKLTGGGVSYPATPSILPILLGFNEVKYTGLASLQGLDQTLGYFPLQIGDGGTNTTYFSAGSSAYAFPQEYSATTVSNWQALWNVPDNGVSFSIYAGASDTIDMSSGLISTDTAQPFTINASHSLSSASDFNGRTIVGYTVTDNVGETWTGTTFKSGGTVTIAGGGDLTNCTISKTTSTNAALAVTADGSVITGTTIDGTGAAYALELGTAVTAITLSSCTLTAGSLTPFDKVHVLKTTGTVVITISGTTTLAAGEVTSAGATVTIAAPQPTLDATVLANSRVVLYNNTTTTELDNTGPAGTSWSKVITSGASANDSLTLHVFKEGYAEFSTTFLYTGADATILVTQAADANLTSLRTELGITDYTTITEFALDTTGSVEIDADDADGNSQKARVAIWYNGVLTTENGARYLRGAISILSTAAFRINVDVLDLLFENISATKGLNFTDTERRLYRSDGTPIWVAASAPGSIQNDYSGVPDTVETGVSGLTGSESAQLMGLPSATTTATAVLSAAQTTPIHADIRKVNSYTVDGNGQTGTEWGPA